jgi:glucan phosphoethanolaminetransferase (alkaline phosphatase superfamily)
MKKDIKENVMDKIKKEEIRMWPRYYFILASIFTLLGLIASAISSIFLISVISFLLRSHGPMGEYRLNLMIESFPWYLPLLAIFGIILGIAMLRRYDFSYKRNMWLIVGAFFIAVILTGVFMDISGLNNVWLDRGPMNSVTRNYMQENGIKDSNNYGHGAGKGNGYRSRNLK